MGNSIPQLEGCKDFVSRVLPFEFKTQMKYNIGVYVS